jgi:hypothetical protein
LHFQREHHAEACSLEEPKILEGKYREASGPWVLCLGHYNLLCHKPNNLEHGVQHDKLSRRSTSSTICSGVSATSMLIAS